MSADEIHELERALRTHADLLRILFSQENVKASSLHHPIASSLRVLLTDSDCPILTKYADIKKVPLKIWAPESAIGDGAVFSVNFAIAGWVHDPSECLIDMKKRPLSEFLHLPICSSLPPGKLGSQVVTPWKLIKWVANKEGFSHLDFKKPGGLELLKTFKNVTDERTDDEILVRHYILQIGMWALHAINDALSYQQDATILLKFAARSPISEEYGFYKRKSSATDVILEIFGTVDGLRVEISHGRYILLNQTIRFMENDLERGYVTFAIAYDAKVRKVELILNGRSEASFEDVSLGGMFSATGDFRARESDCFESSVGTIQSCLRAEDVAAIHGSDWANVRKNNSKS